MDTVKAVIWVHGGPELIVSFGDKATSALYYGKRGKAPASVRSVAIRKLDVLNGVQDLTDLRSPPGNRLELLRGDFAGLHSIRVNDQWRVVFRWTDGDAHDVCVVDYR